MERTLAVVAVVLELGGDDIEAGVAAGGWGYIVAVVE